MYNVAKTLVALSTKAVLIALATTFALFFTLGYFISMWIFYVPLALMGLRFIYSLVTVLRSAMKVGWPLTFKTLMIEIQLVQEEQAAEDAAAKARIEANMAKLRGEEPPEPELALVTPLKPEAENTDEKSKHPEAKIGINPTTLNVRGGREATPTMSIIGDEDIKTDEEPKRPPLRLVSNGDD